MLSPARPVILPGGVAEGSSSFEAPLQFVTDGVLVGKFRPDDSRDELDIRVRFPATDRSLAAFDQLMINTPMGPVPASYFVKRLAAQQVTVIHRRNSQRLVLLQANAGGDTTK